MKENNELTINFGEELADILKIKKFKIDISKSKKKKMKICKQICPVDQTEYEMLGKMSTWQIDVTFFSLKFETLVFRTEYFKEKKLRNLNKMKTKLTTKPTYIFKFSNYNLSMAENINTTAHLQSYTI